MKKEEKNEEKQNHEDKKMKNFKVEEVRKLRKEWFEEIGYKNEEFVQKYENEKMKFCTGKSKNFYLFCVS